MRNLKAVCLFCFLSAISFSATPPSESDDRARVIQAALQPSPIESNLRHLTDEIGGRVPGCPVLGGHVDVGAGAKVLGGITIGDHAKIGANAVVLSDVPSGATAPA